MFSDTGEFIPGSVLSRHGNGSGQAFENNVFLILVEVLPILAVDCDTFDRRGGGMTKPDDDLFGRLAGWDFYCGVDLAIGQVADDFVVQVSEIRWGAFDRDFLAVFSKRSTGKTSTVLPG